MAKKSVIITIYRSELLYDLQAKTHMLGLGKDDAAAADRVQSTDDEDRLSLSRRSLNAAIADMRAAVSEFSPEGPATADNYLPPADGDVVLSLSLPTNYNDGATAGLMAAVHRYVIDRALAEWLTVTDAPSANAHLAQAEVDMVDVKRLLLSRKRPERRRCHHHGPKPSTVNYLWLDADVWLDADLWTEQ
jgi:hypothetical protein